MKKFDDITEPEDFNPEEMQLEFAPGCFDDFEGTQEELDEMIEHIKEMFAAGKFVTHGRELTDEDFDTLSESTQQRIIGLNTPDQPKRNLN
jgi:nicotinamidase-related amidase